jgi:hypothetical protein
MARAKTLLGAANPARLDAHTGVTPTELASRVAAAAS